MSPRSYLQTRRAEQTRARHADLVAAACQLVETTGFHGLALENVAAAAGVTRRTVYNQFGSKLGLLEAILDRVAERGHVADLTAAVEIPDCAVALRALLNAHRQLWSSERLLLRRLLGLAAVDPETAATIAAREKRRREPWAILVGRLAAAGRLRPGFDEERAVTVLMFMNSFAAFDALVPPGAEQDGDGADLLLSLAGTVVDL